MSYAISTIGDVAPAPPAASSTPVVITVAGLVAGAAIGALATWYVLYRRKRR